MEISLQPILENDSNIYDYIQRWVRIIYAKNGEARIKEALDSFKDFFINHYENHNNFTYHSGLNFTKPNHSFTALISQKLINNEDVKKNIVWLNSYTFIDKRLANESIYSYNIKTNVVQEAYIDKKKPDLIKIKTLLRAIFRMMYYKKDLTEENLLEEIDNILDRNQKYHKKRTDNHKQALKAALLNPSRLKTLNKKNSNSHRAFKINNENRFVQIYQDANYNLVALKQLLEKDKKDLNILTSVLVEHSTKTRSKIYSQINALDTKNRFSTIIKKSCNNKVYLLSKEADYFLNLAIIYGINTYKTTVVKTVKSLIKLTKENKAITPFIKLILPSEFENIENWYHDKEVAFNYLYKLLNMINNLKLSQPTNSKIVKLILNDLVANESGALIISYRHVDLLNILDEAILMGFVSDAENILKSCVSFNIILTNLYNLVSHKASLTFENLIGVSKTKLYDPERVTKINNRHSLNINATEIIKQTNKLIESDCFIKKTKVFNITRSLVVGIYSPMDYDAWLGVIAKGVCIDYASLGHISLISENSINIVVFGEDSVEAWLFAVKCKDETGNNIIAVNSFQGNLKTKYKKHESDILTSIVNILKSFNAKVLFVDWNFNSFNLSEITECSEHKGSKLILPSNMRLDIHNSSKFISLN